MIRRLAVVATALVATASLTSCATFDRTGDAAVVNGHHLSEDDVAAIAGTPLNGSNARNVVSSWIQLQLLTGGTDVEPTADALQAALNTAVDQFAGQFLEKGRAAYEEGKVLSPVLCLGAIALDGTVPTDEVLAALEGGMSFADAAAAYSVDSTLAGNGGVVTVQDADCAGPESYNQQLMADIAAADPEIGEYFTTKLGDFDLVMQLRPYDELSDSAKRQLALPTAQMEARSLFTGADVWVSSRYGAWSADQATVLAIGA
ncbi:MAG: hypothetical protein KDB06_08765 [Ilumatobacter sp.]|nr:hypothetical protein [Ilumatobacter sp.]